nr:hypothetical protein [Tanacetum cinerariifolium]
MADENVPAQAPIRSDDQILPFAAWFWNTLTHDTKTKAYSFQLDETQFSLDDNLLMKALEITPIDQAHQFVSPPSGDAIMDFVNQLGYTKVIHFVSRMAEEFVQAIQTFLTYKANMGSPTKKGRKDKPHVIPYCRFTKIIIYFKLGNLKFIHKGEIDEVFGMLIPDELNSNNIINAPYYNAYLEMATKHDQKLAAEKEGKKKTPPKPKPAVKKASKPAPAPKSKASKERTSKASADKPPKPKPAKEKSTKTTLPQPAGKGKVVKVRKAKSQFQLVDEPDEDPAHSEREPKLTLTTEEASTGPSPQPLDDTSTNIVRDSSSPANAKTGVGYDKTSNGDPEPMHDDFMVDLYPNVQESLKFSVDEHVFVEDSIRSSGTLSSMKNLEDAFTIGDQFINDKSTEDDPKNPITLESRPLPEQEVMDEDQAGPDPGESCRALAGPDPEPTHDEFMAELSTGTLFSMKNLEDEFAIGDQFINDKSTEDEPEKPDVEAKVVSMVPIPIYQASSSVPPLSTPILVIDLSPPKPALSTTQAPVFTATTTITTTPLLLPPQQQSLTESKLAERVAALEKKLSTLEQTNKILVNTTRNLGSRPIPGDEGPTTPEPSWIVPSSHIPDAMNNWAEALATTYQALAENTLLKKTKDMRTFMHWYCQQMGKTELTQADFEGQVYEIVKAFYLDAVHLQFQMEECYKMIRLTGLIQKVINKGSGQALSICKMKSARYLDFGLEQLIPKHMWINETNIMEALDYRVKEYKVNGLNPGRKEEDCECQATQVKASCQKVKQTTTSTEAKSNQGKPSNASTDKPPKPKPAKEKSTKTTLPQPTDKGKVVKVHKAKSEGDEDDMELAIRMILDSFQAQSQEHGGGVASTRPSAQPLDDTAANIVRDSPSLADAEIGARSDKTSSGDPGRTLESRPLPEQEVMDEDQAGPDPGESCGALAGPDPEPTHDEFMAELSTGTLFSMKNLEDEFAIGDQFINDKSTEDEPEKPDVEAKVVSMVPIPIYQASSSVPPLSTPILVIDLSPPKPALSTTQAPVFTATTTITTTPLLLPPQQQSLTESKLAERVAALEKKLSTLEQTNKILVNTTRNLGSRVYNLELKDLPHKIDEAIREKVKEAVQIALQAPIRDRFRDLSKEDMKEILHQRMFKSGDEGPTTPEPSWIVPSSHIPDAMNNWAEALATTYQALAENTLLKKTKDMRTFMHWYCQQMGKTELTQADFEGQVYEIVKAFYLDAVHLQFQMEECYKMIRLTGLIQKVINKGSGQALSICKMKSARYLDFGLEQLIPKHMWINETNIMEALDYRVKEYKVNGLNP